MRVVRHYRPSPRCIGSQWAGGAVRASRGLRGVHHQHSSAAGPATTTPPTTGTAGAAPPREYFYWVDLRGHLYCIDKDATTLPRQNDPAFLRDGRFLNFFWRQLQLNTPTSPGWARHGAIYPYVSPCGRELNYVRAADRPIAFHSLQTLPSGESVLLYAHDLSVPFDPTELCMRDNGRLYHPSPVGLGLLRSALASELSGCIEGDEEFVFGWRDRRTPIRRIDDHTAIDADHQ